jgi:hypothetical protein
MRLASTLFAAAQRQGSRPSPSGGQPGVGEHMSRSQAVFRVGDRRDSPRCNRRRRIDGEESAPRIINTLTPTLDNGKDFQSVAKT